MLLTNMIVDGGAGIAAPVGKYITDVLQGRPAIDYAAQTLEDTLEARAAAIESMEKPADARPPRQLDAYTGFYTSPTLGQVEVIVENGKLAFKLGPHKLPATLDPWSGDIFISHMPVSANGPSPQIEKKKLEFLSNQQDSIVGFKWEESGDGLGQPPFMRDEDVTVAK